LPIAAFAFADLSSRLVLIEFFAITVWTLEILPSEPALPNQLACGLFRLDFCEESLGCKNLIKHVTSSMIGIRLSHFQALYALLIGIYFYSIRY
jgi:hypothetical protein